MTLKTHELPDDIETLKRIIVDQVQLMERMQREHQAAIAALFRRYYGPRSERFDPRQLLLFGQKIENAPLDTASVEEEAGQILVSRHIRRRHPHGRSPLPEHLERVDIEEKGGKRGRSSFLGSPFPKRAASPFLSQGQTGRRRKKEIISACSCP